MTARPISDNSGDGLDRVFKWARAAMTASDCQTTAERQSQDESGSANVAESAVSIATRIFERLAGLNLLLIGDGPALRACGQCFRAQGVSATLLPVGRRLPADADSATVEGGGETLAIDALPLRLAEFDLVASCTEAALPFIGTGMVARATRQRKHRPMLVFDLALAANNVEPEVAELDDAFLFTAEDLEAFAPHAEAASRTPVMH